MSANTAAITRMFGYITYLSSAVLNRKFGHTATALHDPLTATKVAVPKTPSNE